MYTYMGVFELLDLYGFRFKDVGPVVLRGFRTKLRVLGF